MAHPLLAGFGRPMELEHVVFATVCQCQYIGDVINKNLTH